MRQPVQEHDNADPADALIASYLPEGAEWIGSTELEGPAMLRIQRFRQQEIGTDEIQERQSRSTVERHARAEFAEKPADDGAKHEADTKSHADQAEILRAVLVIADVGDIGRTGRKARAADAGKNAADEQHPVGAGDRADEIVDRECQHGCKQ